MGTDAEKRSSLEVFLVFLKLGLTSFGGPVAHLGYFRSEIVEKRKWLSEANYADIVALCQFLPGPASSQVGIAIGMSRSGWRGALAAWTAFTLPSALALYLFAQGVAAAGGNSSGGWLHGLKVAAVAVVALAILGMARTLTPDRIRASVAAVAMVAAFVLPSACGHIGGIVLGAFFGMMFLKGDMPSAVAALPLAISRRVGAVFLFTFFALLLGLPPDRRDAQEPRADPVRHLLSGRGAGVRRWTRRTPTSEGGGCAELHQRERFSGGVWRGSGCAGSSVHIRRLHRFRGRGLESCSCLHRRDFYVVVPDCAGRPPILE